jgi:hypothetical protein
MLRRLTLFATVFLLLLGLRRVLATIARQPTRPGSDPRGARRARAEHMVCGECGTGFDPDKTAGLCPKCRK